MPRPQKHLVSIGALERLLEASNRIGIKHIVKCTNPQYTVTILVYLFALSRALSVYSVTTFLAVGLVSTCLLTWFYLLNNPIRTPQRKELSCWFKNTTAVDVEGIVSWIKTHKLHFLLLVTATAELGKWCSTPTAGFLLLASAVGYHQWSLWATRR
jgi:hypothetical protein